MNHVPSTPLRLALVILNRNEEVALRALLPRLPSAAQAGVDLVFAVDGASTDASPRLLAEHGIEVLPQRAPGRGEAFRLAFAHARGRADALVFFSADGNEDPADIGRFRPFLERGADMVIGSRMLAGARNEEDGQLWRPRKWANKAFAAAAWATWGRRAAFVTDPINGFRAITVAAWDRLQPDGSGYTIEYQTSIRAYKLGLRVEEFATCEQARLGGASGAHAVPTGLRFVRLFARELQGTPAGGRAA